MGEHDTSVSDGEQKHGYSACNLDNVFAIIKPASPVSFSVRVSPICLPSASKVTTVCLQKGDNADLFIFQFYFHEMLRLM